MGKHYIRLKRKSLLAILVYIGSKIRIPRTFPRVKWSRTIERELYSKIGKNRVTFNQYFLRIEQKYPEPLRFI